MSRRIEDFCAENNVETEGTRHSPEGYIVPQDVRCNVLALQGWAGLGGDGGMLGQNILHPIRAEMPASSVGEQDLAVASGGLHQPGLQGGTCLFCQRRATFLSPFADNMDVRTGAEDYILSLEAGDLRQPCAGLM
jgi:hypothetical protein